MAERKINRENLRLLVCGSRDWVDKEYIRSVLSSYDSPTIITGGCRGADNIAHSIATDFGFKTVVFPADWKKHGKSAGPVRNGRMLREGKPDLVIAFHDDLDNSKGTKDMLRQAEKAGIDCVIFT